MTGELVGDDTFELGPPVLACPRCGGDRTGESYYGVCSSCATELRSTFDGSPRTDVASTDYEPKMNVTPNAVASKE